MPQPSLTQLLPLCCLCFCLWPLGPDTLQLFATPGTEPFEWQWAHIEKATIEELKQRREDLKIELAKTRMPKLRTFWAFGKDYPLPCLAEEALGLPSPELLHYFAGFFESHGIVSTELNGLFLAQTPQGAEVLYLFLWYFGGSIVATKPETGTTSAVLQWCVYGVKAREAAELLGCSCLGTKKRQLDLFERGLAIPKNPAWRVTPGDGDVKFQTWHELAGFFDARGTIMLRTDGSLWLEMGQRSLWTLNAIQQFLEENEMTGAVINVTSKGGYSLTASGVDAVLPILSALVGAGLQKKRAQAELLLASTEASPVLKAWIGTLKGGRKRYARQDAEGDARSLEIVKLKRQQRFLRKTLLREPQRAQELQEELQALNGTITRLQQVHQNEELRRHVKAMMLRSAQLWSALEDSEG